MSHLHRQYFSLTAAVPLLRQWTTRTVYYFSIYQIQLPIYKFLQYLKSRNHLDVYVSSVSCDILSQHPGQLTDQNVKRSCYIRCQRHKQMFPTLIFYWFQNSTNILQAEENNLYFYRQDRCFYSVVSKQVGYFFKFL